MLRSLSLVLVLTALAASAALAQTIPAAAADTDTTDVYETRRNHVLAFPQYVWNAMVFPIGEFTIWLERKEILQRLIEMFTFEDLFDLYPYVTLGGETGNAGGFEMLYRNLFGRGKGISTSFIANPSNYSGLVGYEDPGIGGGPWYWNVSLEALKTGYEDATINGELRGSGSLLEHQQRDSRLAFGPPLQLRRDRGVRTGCRLRAAAVPRLPQVRRRPVSTPPTFPA